MTEDVWALEGEDGRTLGLFPREADARFVERMVLEEGRPVTVRAARPTDIWWADDHALLS